MVESSSPPILQSHAHDVKLFPPCYNGAGSTPEIQTKLSDHNKQELSTLLRLTFVAFWSTVIYPRTPAYSVAKFLDAYFRQCPKDPELSQKVFRLICRLAIAPLEAEPDFSADQSASGSDSGNRDHTALSEWASNEWPDSVYNTGLLSFPRLLDIATAYGDSNSAVLGNAFDCVMKAQPKLLRDMKMSVRLVVQMVHHVQKKYGKASKGKGKGKGKGKDISSADLQSPSSVDGSVFPGGTVGDDITLLYQAMRGLRGALSIGGESFAAVILDNPEFVPALTDTYEVANILSRSDSEEESNLQFDMGDLVDVEEAVLNDAADLPSQARCLKATVLMLVETIIQIHFFTPLQLTSNDSSESVDAAPTPSMADVYKRTETLCDVVIQLLELSTFDGPVKFLGSAPLLVDLEVYFSLSDWMKNLREKYFQNDEDARLEYMIASLEQLLTFSGNAETKRVLTNRKTEKARLLAAAEINALGTPNSLPRSVVAPIDVNPADETFIKRTSLISQVQDLFPELGEGFIEACLVALNDDAELVIMKILEDDLPEVVQRLDRQMQRTALVQPPPPPPRSARLNDAQLALKWNGDVEEPLNNLPLSNDTLAHEEVAVDTSILSARRNIHDGDEFDIFKRGQVDMAKVIFGKKTDKGNVLDDKSFVREQRDALLATQYDEYDDEYDDTYDTSDIKLAGTVEPPTAEENEKLVESRPVVHVSPVDPFAAFEADLVALYTTSPGVFAKAQRRTPAREQLRAKTGMTDEQIEGWGTMLTRNPRKNKVLEKYEFRGNKAPPMNTNRPPAPGDEQDDDEQSSDENENGGRSGSRPAGQVQDRNRGGRGGAHSGRGSGGSGRGGGRGGGQSQGRGGKLRGRGQPGGHRGRGSGHRGTGWPHN
ncbi:hypothetical protein DFJ77DRAFT_444712 [Powellomyces hirtus]|nr:hypothetical protein DFJ77DRAFT_444712 [Powellomyces hirtus]